MFYDYAAESGRQQGVDDKKYADEQPVVVARRPRS